MQPPYGECSDDKILKFAGQYTIPGCLVDCREDFLVKACKCRLAYMPAPPGEIIKEIQSTLMIMYPACEYTVRCIGMHLEANDNVTLPCTCKCCEQMTHSISTWCA